MTDGEIQGEKGSSGKTARSGEQAVAGEGTCTDRPGFTAAESVTAAHWVQTDDCSVK